MSGDLIRANEYDDPEDDTPRDRAERIALTRFRRDLDKANTVEAIDAVSQRLQADLDAARKLDTTTTTTTTTR